MSASCPFCDVTLPWTELELHVNIHLEEDQLARDMELAQQMAFVSPTSKPRDHEIDVVEPSSVTSSDCSDGVYRKFFDQEKVYSLVSLQIRSSFYQVESGIMNLLRRCLESESQTFISVISGHVDHYQSIKSEDSGWGCGWRNIQMLSSHLLMLRKEAKDALFGGSGFVPDIPFLQRWLEIAWDCGFDRTGSNSFNQNIYGSRKWIGTTECATIFRFFGLRARVVDFDSMSYSLPSTSYALRGQETPHVYGPMDRFVERRNDNTSSKITQHEHQHNNRTVVGHDHLKGNDGKFNGHQVLVDWVWNYFTSDVCRNLDNIQHVRTSEKMPLYFQHNGHSRTIVGIQKQQGIHGSQDRYSLLILDPGQRTEELERCLKYNKGWQRLVKRGVHTLRKPQYQLCYVDPGMAYGKELEQLKTIESILIRL